MSEIIRRQFWDVGGVLLTNGWDRVERGRAVERFHLDGRDFERRHSALAGAFDRGRIGLDAYLQETVFYAPRRFSRDEFRTFMCEQSQPNSEMLSIVAGLARSGRYLMATLNNESLELNRHRIDTFRRAKASMSSRAPVIRAWRSQTSPFTGSPFKSPGCPLTNAWSSMIGRTTLRARASSACEPFLIATRRNCGRNSAAPES